MATENTMANEIDPDKSLIQNQANDDGISDSLVDNVEEPANANVEEPAIPADKKEDKPKDDLKLVGKIDLSFDNLQYQRKTIGPTAEYNKILEKIVKGYKKWEVTNYGTYAKKIGEHTVEYNGYSLPTLDGNLISDYLINPTEEVAEVLRKIR